MNYYNDITELIGKTPLIRLHKIKNKLNLKANIFAKVEFFNPGGSIKDRTAKAMIDQAIKENKLKPDTKIFEPTSGNTGIGASLLGAFLDYDVTIVMPESVSRERIKIVEAFGAKVILTDKAEGMQGSIKKVEELMRENKNSITLSQFENMENPNIHYQTTGPEIYADLEGDIDVFVSAIGTGGTISGAGKYLKEKIPNIDIYGVEPEKSAVLNNQSANSHKIQGIGAGFIPHTLNTNIYDEVLTVSDDLAFLTTSLVIKEEGIFCGISSGAALSAAIELAKLDKYQDKNIVVIFPDTGERYLSVEEFAL